MLTRAPLILLPALALADSFSSTYGPQILSNAGDGVTVSSNIEISYDNSDWASVDYAQAVWLSAGGPTQVGWRNENSANVEGSEIVFVYETSVPDAINGNTNQFSDDFAASGFLYSTAEVTYPAKTKSINDRRSLTKRDILDGPYVQIPWTSRYISVEQAEDCPYSSVNFTIEVVDAANVVSSTTSGKLDIPANATWPLTINFLSDPYVGNGTAIWQDEQPLQYTIGSGSDVPSVYAYTYVGMYFCETPEDD